MNAETAIRKYRLAVSNEEKVTADYESGTATQRDLRKAVNQTMDRIADAINAGAEQSDL